MKFINTPNVASILSAFSKTINDLEKLAEAKIVEAEKATEDIAKLVEKKKAAQAESGKALAISEKLVKLISE